MLKKIKKGGIIVLAAEIPFTAIINTLLLKLIKIGFLITIKVNIIILP